LAHLSIERDRPRVTAHLPNPPLAQIMAAMGRLSNARRELFAQALVGNVDKPCSQTKAYRLAGYVSQGHAAHVGASRMMANAEVSARVAELMEPAARETGLSIERLLVEIERTLREAREDRAHSACIAALSLVLRVHELISSQGSAELQFASGTTADDVEAALLESMLDLGEDQARRLAEKVLAAIADRAIPVG
jgi:hypothetical protein